MIDQECLRSRGPIQDRPTRNSTHSRGPPTGGVNDGPNDGDVDDDNDDDYDDGDDGDNDTLLSGVRQTHTCATYAKAPLARKTVRATS